MFVDNVVLVGCLESMQCIYMTHTSVRCCAVVVKHDGDATTQGAVLEIGQLMFESRHSKMPRCILFVIAALAI